MSVSATDTLSSNTPTQSGYWHYEPSSHELFKGDELSRPNEKQLPGRTLSALQIDGNATNAGDRSTTQTADGKDVYVDPLHETREVSIARERTIVDGGFGQRYVSSDQLVFTTGAGNDNVGVSRNDDGTYRVTVNGEEYDVAMAPDQELTIRSGAGNDVIAVDPDVDINIVVDGGAGNDRITTGAGNDRVDGGIGDDIISTGAGRDDVFGNGGKDRIDAGAGDDVVYGGDGDDELLGAAGNDYLEGGEGADRILGGDGDDMLSGGLGNDTLESELGNDRVYTGGGSDTVSNSAGSDTVYAQATSDRVSAADGARNTVVNIELSGTPGSQGVSVQGSDAFRQRVEADIEFLRSSPNGQQMLAEFDAAAAQGNTVTIVELQNEQNGFASSSGGEIVNGRPSPGSDVTIAYNPAFHMADFPAPVVVLFHEMSHAYNGVNGTFQPGAYAGSDLQDVNAGVPNAERQAVGLDTTAPAFDFDRNPNTPPTTHNPTALTENGLRTELGLPLREHYAL